MSAAASCLLTEDQFLCSICLDVFTDPVTIPCGHNFCKTCITEHWDKNVQCQCPNCKEVFDPRPGLQVNTFIFETTAQFKQSAEQKPENIPCDVHSGTKLQAWMSCLVCLICVMLWMFLDHKTHDVVPLEKEYEGMEAELWKTEVEIEQMMQMRQLKIEEIKHSVELSKEDSDRDIADGVQVFTALKESVERSQAELMDTIKEKQRKTEKQAEGFITELEQEISELMKRRTEVEQLSQSEDHLHLLQSPISLKTALSAKDWTEVSVRLPNDWTVLIAVNQLLKILSEQKEKLLGEEITKLLEAELKRVQQYAVDLTLDPGTANPWLILSEDGKQVNCGNECKCLPDNPERFSKWANVLAKQSFSSGRFYFEVQVKGKIEWDLGVVQESIDRKGNNVPTPHNGFWTMCLRNDNEYKALDDPSVRLSLKSGLEKVGVFVDYEEGLVTFYDVDAAVDIYHFTRCSFTEKLYPYFSPGTSHGGKNAAPLIISPVSHTE